MEPVLYDAVTVWGRQGLKFKLQTTAIQIDLPGHDAFNCSGERIDIRIPIANARKHRYLYHQPIVRNE